MNAYPTQFDGQLGALDGTHASQEYASELHDSADMLKEQLREAKFCADEERKMKSLDGLMNTLLLCAGATAFINKFATMQHNFRLYHRHTTVVAGVNDVFRTISNGTFTSGTILSVFAAPSFTSLVLQGVMDACLFVPPFIVAIAIFGKWVLGHFATSTSEDIDVQMRRRPMHDWPPHVRARVLSWSNALPVLFALSQALCTLCWLFGRQPLLATCVITVLALWCSIILFVLKKNFTP
ncbi:uncharacterized protein F5891DRAFT_1034937 [Suillus fuscotomentosus]|uniref:Uncharacterized protein n=1 Tax=Suillus fuscotomentosus TaxID=1912939 RepID=A0AAD4E5T0_9AGAM|nr:uncharacterized protein F5891DRAFT_1034937 [Suillus fuscotomentosus]KAG1900263.1 hypothetical protein F5891DRAFT_1034937 [Suillus fuscotomentosus]